MARKILTLVFVFAAFYMGAHYYIRWKNTVTDDVTKISRMVDCEPNQVRGLKIEQVVSGNPQIIQMRRVDQPEPGIPAATAVSRWQWKFEGAPGGEADPVVIRRIASTICELYDPIPARAEAFQPAVGGALLAKKVVATLSTPKGEQTLSFEFGANEGRSTVLRFEDANQNIKTYKIPDRFLQVASRPLEEFRNLRVMRLEADNVMQATLKIDGKERFSLERAGADWKVLVSGKEKGDGSEEAGRFLNRISTLRALDVEAADFSAKDCAGAKARAELNVHAVGGREETVRFDYGKGGSVDACSSLGSQKLRVHKDLVQYLDIPVNKVLAN